MTPEFDLEFCFKGSRTYVHGTDIFTEISKYYSDSIKNIDIAFHGITLNNMTFIKDKPRDKEVKVTFRCLDNENKIKLFGVENDNAIHCNYEYLEKRIVDNSTANSTTKSISLNIPTEYLFIEHIVAMNKALVETLYPEVEGKWYFTRLQLKEFVNMSDVSSLQLVLKSNFQFKLTKSTIFVNDTEIGHIFFSLIPKEV